MLAWNVPIFYTREGLSRVDGAVETGTNKMKEYENLQV